MKNVTESNNDTYPLPPESSKTTVELAWRVLEILKAHPKHSEAKAALVIAGELLPLDRKLFVGKFVWGASADDSLHEERLPVRVNAGNSAA